MRRRQRVYRAMSGCACALVVALAVFAAPAAPVGPVVRADEAGDAAALRELAQRAVSGMGTGTVELLPGQLPADLPFALPLPMDARLIGTVTRRTMPRQVTWDVLFDATTPPEALVAFYERELGATGWAAPKPFDYAGYYMPSGFQSRQTNVTPGPTATPRPPPTLAPTAPRNTALCAPNGGDTSINVIAQPASGGVTNVTVRVSPANYQCGMSRRSTPQPLPTPPIPALPPPMEGTVSLIDYEELGNSVSDAAVETDLSAAEVEMFYAAQLQAAGWTRIAGYVRGPLAWSVWSTPKGKQGYLSVLEIAGTRTRDVHIQVGSLSDS